MYSGTSIFYSAYLYFTVKMISYRRGKKLYLHITENLSIILITLQESSVSVGQAF